MIIRRTTQEDLPGILELVKEFHVEHIDKYDIFCNEDVLNNAMPGMVETSMVLEVDGKVRGVMAGIITHHIQDDSKVFQEIIWFVTKAYRKYGIRLLRDMETLVKELGCKSMVMVTLGDEMFDKLDKLYRKIGYKYLETQYTKTL